MIKFNYQFSLLTQKLAQKMVIGVFNKPRLHSSIHTISLDTADVEAVLAEPCAWSPDAARDADWPALVPSSFTSSMIGISVRQL